MERNNLYLIGNGWPELIRDSRYLKCREQFLNDHVNTKGTISSRQYVVNEPEKDTKNVAENNSFLEDFLTGDNILLYQ